ncbi:MAG: hypothetical protein GYB68_11035 [Chloroflexi bacterium]|nr:hypothetical protein [Chloroflexota bacterium]
MYAITLPLMTVVGLLAAGLTYWVASRMLVRPWHKGISDPNSEIEKDISDLKVPLPSSAGRIAKEIERLGFTPFGISETDVGGQIGRAWYYANPEGTIFAEIIDYMSSGALQFSAIFPDDSLIEVSFPIGENITTPTYIARFTREGVQQAFNIMQKLVTEQRQQKQITPRQMNDMVTILAWEPIWRSRYRPIKYRAPQRRGIITGLFAALAVGSAAAGLVVAVIEVFPNPDEVTAIATTLGLSVMGAGIVFAGATMAMVRLIMHHAGQ